MGPSWRGPSEERRPGMRKVEAGRGVERETPPSARASGSLRWVEGCR